MRLGRGINPVAPISTIQRLNESKGKGGKEKQGIFNLFGDQYIS
jgi:hypothetical protein